MLRSSFPALKRQINEALLVLYIPVLGSSTRLLCCASKGLAACPADGGHDTGGRKCLLPERKATYANERNESAQIRTRAVGHGVPIRISGCSNVRISGVPLLPITQLPHLTSRSWWPASRGERLLARENGRTLSFSGFFVYERLALPEEKKKRKKTPDAFA